MPLRVNSVVLNTTDMRRSLSFWTAVLGAELVRGGPDADWSTLGLDGGSQLALQLGEVPQVRPQPIHLDLVGGDRAAEVERVVGLGAQRVDDWPYPDDADYTVLRDPDGHLFCVVDP